MRYIPDNNLAYPVLLTLDTGSTGSGFYLKVEDKMYLVTANHVLRDRSDNLYGKKLALEAQTSDLQDDSVEKVSVDFEVVNLLTHSTADVITIHIADLVPQTSGSGYDTNYVDGVTCTQDATSTGVYVEVTATKKLEHILTSNEVIVYGYPTSLGLKSSAQFDYDKPLLRKGIVANTYPSKGTIILDCPVYPGNSGGPVAEVEEHLNGEVTHQVIGVVSQFIPHVQKWINQSNGLVNREYVNSGYSVAVSMDKVFETIGYTP